MSRVLHRLSAAALACLLAGVALAQPAAPAVMKAAAGAFDEAYRVGPEDVLEISVWKEDGLRREVLVRPDGGLSFPLVGDIAAGGMTVAELRAEVGRRIERYIPDANVTVILLRVGANKVYVLGRVNKPGEFPAGRFIDVLQALAMAGGLTPFAVEREIRIIRKVAGRDEVFPFDFTAVSRGQRMEQNIRLRGGDVVLVP